MNKYYITFIMKVVFFIGVFFLFTKRFELFPILNNEVLKTVSTVIVSIVGGLLVLFLYRSITELMDKQFEYNDKKKKTKPIKSKMYSFENLIKIIEREDIIDIEIMSRVGVVKIGASSDYDQSKDKFFDKLYYINDKEYNTIEEFKDNLVPNIINPEEVSVLYLE